MPIIGTTKIVLYMEVSLFQRLNNIMKYYYGTRTHVLSKKVSFIEEFHYKMCLFKKVLYSFVCTKTVLRGNSFGKIFYRQQ